MEGKDELVIHRFVESLSEEQSSQLNNVIKILKNNELSTLTILLELLKRKTLKSMSNMQSYKVGYNTEMGYSNNTIICEEGKAQEELETRLGCPVEIDFCKKLDLGRCYIRDLTAQDLLNLLKIK